MPNASYAQIFWRYMKTEFLINERNRIVYSNSYERKRRDIKSNCLIGKFFCMPHYTTNE